MTINIENTPVPIRIYIGPGHAPAKAHPNPKMVPPIIYLENPFCFKGTFKVEPSIVFILLYFETNSNITPVATAVPMMPYI